MLRVSFFFSFLPGWAFTSAVRVDLAFFFFSLYLTVGGVGQSNVCGMFTGADAPLNADSVPSTFHSLCGSSQTSSRVVRNAFPTWIEKLESGASGRVSNCVTI